MCRIVIVGVILFFIFKFETVFSQCKPAGTDLCEEAYVFCSLDELNGYTCTNPNYQNVVGPDPICPGDTHPHNITWWSFVSKGGNVCITLKYSNCVSKDSGLQYGIYTDCSFVDLVACDNSCGRNPGIKTICADLTPCKTYYLFIDGCFGDVCDFTINTTGGDPPILAPISYINNISSGIIQPVCVGICNYDLFVDPQPGGCEPSNYIWTLDGLEVGLNSNQIQLDFPVEGDFILCVKATIGNPSNGSVCSEEQRCATVKVRPLAARIGVTRTICYEAIYSGGYPWHSKLIEKSGIYTERIKQMNCCEFDSIVEFKVRPYPVTRDVFYITCNNTPYVDIQNNKHDPCQDHLEINLKQVTNPFMCDSSVRLTAVNVNYSTHWSAKCFGNEAEISPNINILNPCEVGETYQFEYRWYKKRDQNKKTISREEHLLVDTINEDYCIEVSVYVRLDTAFVVCSKIFCDSINESEVKSNQETVKLTFCDSAEINGIKYYNSIQLTQELMNKYGCDSIVHTELSIRKSSQTEISQAACDSVEVNNIIYKQSGKFKQSFQTEDGCDSILNLDIRILSSSQTDISKTACDSVLVNNISYKQSGKYKQILQTIGGCDSILNLDLKIQASSQTEVSQSDCDSVVVNGQVYKASGDFIQSYQNVNGCDSILNIHVNIPKSNTSPLILFECDSITINRNHYTKSGNYSQKLTSANGCDSTLNIDLTIYKSNSAGISFTSCDSAFINGQRYYQSGNYTQLLKNVNLCDSTLNLEIKIQSSSQAKVSQSDCDSIIVNGQSYTQTGDYIQILKNANQCDSLLTVHFTHLKSNLTDLIINSCDSVVVNNQVFKQSGSFSQILSNVDDCDSIINLKINISKSNSTNLNLSSCDSTIVNGMIYSQSGNYTQLLKNVNHCDSTLNINLNISQSSSTNYTINSCDSAIVNGIIYKQSGNYVQYLKSINKCDSLLSIHCNLSKSSESSLIQNACDSTLINGIKYYSSGNYLQFLKNSNGCDSTIRIELTIKPSTNTSLEAGKDTSICQGEIIKLNGVFIGEGNIKWQSNHGSFDNPTSTTPIYIPGVVGDDHIYLLASANCGQLLDSIIIQVLPNQVVKVTGDTIIDPCKEISFIATGGTNYIWTPSSFIDCLDPACNKVKLKSTKVTNFTINTVGPCVVPAYLNLSLSEIQSEIYLPNAFSPNGDNINDQFIPIFNCDQVNYYNLQIFDRWGNLIFESNDKSNGWNGKYQNVNMNPGVYPYFIEYEHHNAGRQIKAGEVTLVR